MSALTVTVKVQELRFVQSSVAVQTTVREPGGNRLPEGGKQLTAILVSALSDAVGAGKFTGTELAPQVQTTTLVGHRKTGGVVSCATVTVKLQDADWRQELVAVQFTVVEPRMKMPPDGGMQATVEVEAQLLDTVGAGYVAVVKLPPQIQFVRLAGQ